MDAPTSAHQDDAGIDENAEPAPILPYGTYILPADARPAGDDKPGRRRVLCTETTWTVLGTVVYGSSQTAPFKQKGLHRVPILGRGEPNPNGFTVGEQFYLHPMLLWYAYHPDLSHRTGELAQHEYDPLCRAMREALGIGTDCGPTSDFPRSRRGWIVKLSKEAADTHSCTYAVILSNHHHASETGSQAIVPLVVVGDSGEQPFDVTTYGPWTGFIGAKPGDAVWATSMVFSVFEPFSALIETPHRVSDREMKRIEDALAARGLVRT